MRHPVLRSFLICEFGRVWYAALEGRATLEHSADLLVRFEARAREQNLRGFLLDVRRAEVACAGDTRLVARRLASNLPAGLALAWLASPSSLRQGLAVSRPLMDAGLRTSVFSDWEAAWRFAGVRNPVPDPLTLDSGDVLELE